MRQFGSKRKPAFRTTHSDIGFVTRHPGVGATCQANKVTSGKVRNLILKLVTAWQPCFEMEN